MKLVVFGAMVGTLMASASFAQTQTTTPAPADKPATINQRLENQQDRIQAGVKDDQLTKSEATRVTANDAAIHAEERVDRKANDGTLTAGEKQHLQKQLNQNSRAIYRARHNNRTPKS
jgi:hypothetical protein